MADDSTVLAQYRSTLRAWAAKHVPGTAIVTGVNIDYDDGYDPTFTDRPASLTVHVMARYGDNPDFGEPQEVATVLTSISDLLTELFAIEEVKA